MSGVAGDLDQSVSSYTREEAGKCLYLVAETLGGNDGDLIAYSLVGLEVEGELGVVSLDNDLGGLLNCLFFGVSMAVLRGIETVFLLTLVRTRPILVRLVGLDVEVKTV